MTSAKSLVVRQLQQNDEAAFLEGLTKLQGEDLEWYSFAWKPGMKFSEMLAVLEKEILGVDLAPGRVPHTMLYGFLDGKIIGRVSVRHCLNENLRKRGGHLGYWVAAEFRKQGLAKQMVGQALEYCKTLKLDSIMISCADDNTPSWKIIEHFGGKLEDRVWDEVDEETIRRYWVALT